MNQVGFMQHKMGLISHIVGLTKLSRSGLGSHEWIVGFGSVEEGEPRLILGKRDATQRGIEETNQGEEAQRLKRKKNGDYSTDSTARVLDHPC